MTNDPIVKLFWRSPVIGFVIGALVGAVASCCLFWLVDFSGDLGDLALMTFYFVVHFGVAGALAASGLTLLYRILLGLGLVDWAAEDFVKGLAVFSGGLAVLFVGAVWNMVRLRPTYLSSTAVWLPVLVGFGLVLGLSIRVLHSSSRSDSRVFQTLPGLNLAAVLVCLALLVPPVFGLVAFGSTRLEPDNRAAGVGNLERGRIRHPSLLVVGWDAATWDVLDPLLAQGRLPNLAGLIEQGSRATLWARSQVLQPFADSASGGARSPAVWESIATGKSARQHGIWDFRIKRFWGVHQPVPFRLAGDYLGKTTRRSSALARSKRFWSVLDDAGLKTAIIGWLTTWPAHSSQHGIVVSDRAAYGNENAVHPPGAVDSDALWEEVKEERDRLLLSLSPELQRVISATEVSSEKTKENQRIRAYLNDLEADIFKYLAAKRLLAAELSPDLVAVVFKVTDLVQHKFWGFYDPQSFGLPSTPESEVLGQVIPSTYDQLDILLGELLEAAGPKRSVIVLSDHGAGPWIPGGIGGIVKKSIQRSFHPDYSGNHRLNGIASFGGPGFASSDVLVEAWGEDIAPTILDYFGLPVADDMVGRALVDVFDRGVRGERSIATIDSYGPPPQLVDQGSSGFETDEEILERLKSLGYVQ